jgi:predicted amidophosphoribosyltransferase
MATYCKGLCERESTYRKTKFSGDYYRNGIKYCRTCTRWLRIDTIQCPCCKNRVSSKSRRYKRKLASNPVKYPELVIATV